jgi:hypothetical protein
MSYEYMGMGTPRDDAREAYDRGTQLLSQRNYSAAYDAFRVANSAVPSDAAVASMGYAAAMNGNCAQAMLHFRQIPNYTFPTAELREQRDRCEASERDIALRPLPPELRENGGGTPDVQKETWWTGDVEGMISGFFYKLDLGERAAEEAEGAAREEGAAASGPTSISEVAPSAQPPRVSVEDTTPWYVQYAPHMVIGGLGLGAVVTLVLVMRKRG